MRQSEITTDPPEHAPSGTLTGVTEKELRVVVREWLRWTVRRRVGASRGYQNKFAKLTGIPRPQLTDALRDDSNVSWKMLARISETIGPPMPELLAELAETARQLELEKAMRGVVIKTEHGEASITPELARQLARQVLLSAEMLTEEQRKKVGSHGPPESDGEAEGDPP